MCRDDQRLMPDLVLMDLGRLRADDVLMAFIGLAERIVLVGSPDDDALRTAADLLGHDRAAGHHAVPVEQLVGLGVRADR